MFLCALVTLTGDAESSGRDPVGVCMCVCVCERENAIKLILIMECN